MTKCLFITFQPLLFGDGVSKKVFAQKHAIESLGYDTHLLYPYQEERFKLMLDERNLGVNCYPGIRVVCRYALNYIKEYSIDVVYIRYTAFANLTFCQFLAKCKSLGCKVVMEIPTFPYDGETGFTFSKASLLKLQEKVFRKFLHLNTDFIVTYSADKEIFGVKTINISNAPSGILPLNPYNKIERTVRMVGVANLAFWHGYDRLIKGLANYKTNSPEYKVEFVIVGNGNAEYVNSLKELVRNMEIEDIVTFVGSKDGEELNEIFKSAHLAIGCLACHRKHIKEVRALKSVEYAMRGIPFVYSENNPDFDGMPYVYKVPADESDIDVGALCHFVTSFGIHPKDIYKTVENKTWLSQMKIVMDTVLNREMD